MKSIASILFLVAALLIAGCNRDEDPVSSNSFGGTWQVVFAGTYTGGGDAIIDAQGVFSLTALLVGQSGTFTNTISGSVTNAGSLNGDIYYSGEKTGTVSGTFSGNGGSGSYYIAPFHPFKASIISQPSSGTWSATLK